VSADLTTHLPQQNPAGAFAGDSQIARSSAAIVGRAADDRAASNRDISTM
jgi:hypothetical protein